MDRSPHILAKKTPEGSLASSPDATHMRPGVDPDPEIEKLKRELSSIPVHETVGRRMIEMQIARLMDLKRLLGQGGITKPGVQPSSEQQPRREAHLIAHFGVVPVTIDMLRGLERIAVGFEQARTKYNSMGRPEMAKNLSAYEATYTKTFLERQKLPQAVELAKTGLDLGYQVIIASEQTGEDLFHRDRDGEPSEYQKLDDLMGGQLKRTLPNLPNVFDTLREEFGDKVGNYSGGDSPEREKVREEFLRGNLPLVYMSMKAGAIGTDWHDADYPELGIKGGDKPRLMIVLGPPYSGVLLEQLMGRPWRYGVKSNVHMVFLGTDAEPDIRLMQTKIGPRMRALRASVHGERDSLAAAMDNYSQEEKNRMRQDMLAYQEGDEVKVSTSEYKVRSKGREVEIANWSAVKDALPNADELKHKGMRPGEGAEVNWSALYQSNFGIPKPDSPEELEGKKVVDKIADAAIAGKIPAVQNLEFGKRKTVVGLASAAATEQVGADADVDKAAAARQAMEAGLGEFGGGGPNGPGGPNNPNDPDDPGGPDDSDGIGYLGLVQGQLQAMESVTRQAGAPGVGRELARKARYQKVVEDRHRSKYWSAIEGVFRKYKLKTDNATIKELTLVVEGKIATKNQAIAAAAQEIADITAIAHDDAAKAGVMVKTPDGRKVPFADFGRDPNYFTHRVDWDYKLNVDGKEVTLRDLMKKKYDAAARQRAFANIPELKPYSYGTIMEYLRRNSPRAAVVGSMHRTRQIDFPFVKRDYATLLGYFDGAAKAISVAEVFGPEHEKLNGLIRKVPNARAQETLNSMFRSVTEPQSWDDASARLYKAAMLYETATKMNFSAAKVPFHLFLAPLAMNGRTLPLIRAMGEFALHPKESMERAYYGGVLSRQMSAADMLYGERQSKGVRMVLKMEVFEAAYKVARAIAGASSRIYMEQYALRDLKREGTRGAEARRLLKDTFLLSDQAIDEAVKNNQFDEESLALGQTAFANYTMFTDSPLEMPMWARMEIRATDPKPLAAMKRAVRLTYAMQSFSLKAVSMLREKLYDEVVVNKNYKPLLYVLASTPILSEMLQAAGSGSRAIVHRGLEGITSAVTGQPKHHTQDSWDKYIAELQDTFGHPDAVKLLKFLIDSYTIGYGVDMVKEICAPFFDLAEGRGDQAGKEFRYLAVDLGEHIIGTFYSDVIKTAQEAAQQGVIAASKEPKRAKEGQKPKPTKHQKQIKSFAKYLEEEWPTLQNIPQIDEIAHPPEPPRKGHSANH